MENDLYINTYVRKFIQRTRKANNFVYIYTSNLSEISVKVLRV